MANSEAASPLPDFTLQKKLFDERIIVLSEPIHSQSAKKVIETLLALEAQDPAKDIWLHLNSPGGEISSGFGIYDTIRFIRPLAFELTEHLLLIHGKRFHNVSIAPGMNALLKSLSC